MCLSRGEHVRLLRCVGRVGLSHDENVRKMQVLTFVQIAEGKTELSFETIEKELQLATDDVEPFIIDGTTQNQSQHDIHSVCT